MENLDPHLVALFTTTGAAFAMMFAGLGKNGLEWRRGRRRCPGCGRTIRNRTCGCT
jgi:hypothetical protein